MSHSEQWQEILTCAEGEPEWADGGAVVDQTRTVAAATTNKNTRGPNFSCHEDILVTKAWILVSADSRNGTGQKLVIAIDPDLNHHVVHD